MSKKANPALVGAFIVGAIVLTVAAVVIFGSGKFLKKTNTFVIFFGGSVKGLDVGAPVNIRGVRIGNVSDIILLVNHQTLAVNIEVVVEIERGKATDPLQQSASELYGEFLKRGLRAQLASESLLTGKLYVDLDFHPNTPYTLTGLDKRHEEIPAIPTDIEKLRRSLDDMLAQVRQYPIKEILDRVNQTMGGVDRLVNSAETTQTLRALRGSVVDLQELVKRLDTRSGHLTDNLDRLLKNVDAQVAPLSRSIQQTAGAARTTLDSANQQLQPLASSLKDASRSAQAALEQAKKTMATVEGAAAQNSPLRGDINEAMQELAKAARSIRVLADYLERHPASLIRGKEQ